MYRKFYYRDCHGECYVCKALRIDYAGLSGLVSFLFASSSSSSSSVSILLSTFLDTSAAGLCVDVSISIQKSTLPGDTYHLTAFSLQYTKQSP